MVPKMALIRVVGAFLLIGIAVGLSSCGSSDPCSLQAEAYIQNSRSLLRRVDTLFSVDNTGRMPFLINELEDARDDARGFDTPSCARGSKNLLVDWLDKYVEVAQAFDGGREFEAEELFDEVMEIERELYDSLSSIEDEE